MEIFSQYDILAPIIAASLAALGAGLGIGQVAQGAMRGMSMTKNKNTRKEITAVLILSGALIEGVALFAMVALLGVVFNLGLFA
jgi:F-type H+-transporting ATPase subunit c